ncbi:MAG: response regulator [Methylobacterium radiotolerans]
MHESSQPFALVVDDDPLILMDACAIVEDAGFRPLEAHTGDAAIALLDRHDGQVDLLFTDVQMPGSRDGFALAREAATRWPHIRILVASGQMTPGPGDLPDGAHFIGKPFSAEVVHDRLKELLPEERKPEPLRRA